MLILLVTMAVSLKPELFEGMRFDFTKGLNQKFSLSHRSIVFHLPYYSSLILVFGYFPFHYFLFQIREFLCDGVLIDFMH